MTSWKSVAVAVLAISGIAGSAAAQGVAGPVPLLGGTERAKHVFSIPGVTGTSTIATFVMCTSLEKTKTMGLAVEVFSEGPTVSAINDVTIGQGYIATVNPGETVTFELTNNGGDLLWTSGSANINIGSLLHGSARVLGTSNKLMCVAGLSEKAATPPASMLVLPVIAKTKQRGT